MIRKKKRNRWLPAILILAVSAVGLLLFFGVIRPYIQRGGETEQETLETEGEESELYGIRLLYDTIARKDMQEITVSNDGHTYAFKRKREADPTADFALYIDGEDYSHVKYNDEKFSSLVVSVGTTYVQERLIDSDALAAATPEEQERIYAKYGLDTASSPAFFEVKKYEKTIQNGKTHVAYKTYRVYVGNKTVSGTGYYLRYNNSAAVYVSNSQTVGEVANAAPAHYAALTLQAAFVENSAQLMKDVTLWERETEKGALVGGEDSVKVLAARLNEDGTPDEKGYAVGTVNLRLAEKALADALIGKSVGDTDIKVSMPASGENGTPYTYHIKKIIAIDRLKLLYNFVNKSERDKFSAGVIYRFEAPEGLTPYVANASSCFDVAELMGAFNATEIVEVGVTDAVLEKYGLTAYTLYLEMPLSVSYSKEPGKADDYVVSGYLPNYLYFSRPTADGTRYVASSLYDVVGVVEADKLSFLDETYFHWIDPYMFMVDYRDMYTMRFDFGYADHDKTYEFLFRHGVDSKGNDTCTVINKENGAILSIDRFGQIYAILTNMRYLDLYAGTEEEKNAIMADKGNLILSLSVEVSTGEVKQYDFYAYSERHALVAVDGAAYFYTETPKIKKLATDIGRVLKGESVDYEKLY